MKKYFVIMLILLVIVCGCDKKKNNVKNDDLTIGTSNEKDNSKLQVKVIIEQINIRKEGTTESDKIGIVKEGSTFDVIDYESDGKYIWFHIKTGNNIEGYIASEIENPYVETNQDIDYEPPEISFEQNTLEVNYRTDIENAIRNNVKFIDNKDDDVKFVYDVDYSNSLGDKTYLATIKATDSGNNYATKQIKVKINAEKQMSDGKWISYNDVIEKQNQANSICYNHNLFHETGVGCHWCNIDYCIDVYNDGFAITKINPYQMCMYDINYNVITCNDENNNNISHDLMSDDFKSLENTWLPRIKSYYEEVKNITGYEFNELKW